MVVYLKSLIQYTKYKFMLMFLKIWEQYTKYNFYCNLSQIWYTSNEIRQIQVKHNISSTTYPSFLSPPSLVDSLHALKLSDAGKNHLNKQKTHTKQSCMHTHTHTHTHIHTHTFTHTHTHTHSLSFSNSVRLSVSVSFCLCHIYLHSLMTFVTSCPLTSHGRCM